MPCSQVDTLAASPLKASPRRHPKLNTKRGGRKVKGIKQFRWGEGEPTAASLRRSARGPEVSDNAGTETARWTARLGGGRRRREEMQVGSPVYCVSWDQLICHTDEWVPPVSMFFLLLFLFLSLLSCSALPPHQSITTARQFSGLAGRGQNLRLRADKECGCGPWRRRRRRRLSRWLRQRDGGTRWI